MMDKLDVLDEFEKQIYEIVSNNEMNFFDKVKAFAELQDKRWRDGYDPEIGFDEGDYFVHNPWRDTGSFDEVDPVKRYGADKFNKYWREVGYILNDVGYKVRHIERLENWIKNITSDDIDLVDKLSNMCENEISEELFDLIDKNEDKYYPRIEAYIKEHAIDYIDFIETETAALYNQELIDSDEDWSSGLYNCDEIYVRAIADALGFLWTTAPNKVF